MSMQFHAQIGTLKLELLRSGPSHNQLLSPLTAKSVKEKRKN